MPKSTIVINHNAFSEITKESAYWAGFLAADGNLRKMHRKYWGVRVYLAEVDIDHLYKFQAFLQSGHKVSHSEVYNRASLEFCSEQIGKDLQDKYLLTERKSLTLEFPELPDGVLPDFIRGYFEGDGCICETFTNKNSSLSSLITRVIGSPEFMKKYSKTVQSALNIPKMPSLQLHPNNINLALKFNTNNSMKFLQWIYGNSTEETRLTRKHALYVKTVVDKDRLKRVMV